MKSKSEFVDRTKRFAWNSSKGSWVVHQNLKYQIVDSQTKLGQIELNQIYKVESNQIQIFSSEPEIPDC